MEIEEKREKGGEKTGGEERERGREGESAY